ncbi:MAG: hypothetical protein ACI4A5_05210 [Hominilimicola sp.]
MNEKLVSHICPVCGTSFIPAPEHAYKVYLRCGVNKSNRYRMEVCSWKCLRVAERDTKRFITDIRARVSNGRGSDGTRKIKETGGTRR